MKAIWILVAMSLIGAAAPAETTKTTPFDFSPRALRSGTLATTTPKPVHPGETYQEYIDSPPNTRTLPTSAMHLSCVADGKLDCGVPGAFNLDPIVRFTSPTGNYVSVRFTTVIKNNDTTPHIISLELYTDVQRSKGSSTKR